MATENNNNTKPPVETVCTALSYPNAGSSRYISEIEAIF